MNARSRTVQTGEGAIKLPLGYRFVPSDEEIVHYLRKKIISGSVPAILGRDFEADAFYSQSPTHLVTCSNGEEREWYVFIHEEENSPRKINESGMREVGNGMGFWKKTGEKTILNAQGEVSAIKYCFIYFEETIFNNKKTHWRMEEYQLPSHIYAQNNIQGMIVLAKLKRGIDYDFLTDYAQNF